MQAEYDRRRLVLLIQLYLVLLIIEGALRKWFLPSLSDPLLLVRDPVAIVICVLGYRSRNLVFDGYMRSLFLLLAAFVAIGALQLINGIGGSPLVIGYGLRTYLLHLPIAFVMARVLNREDVHRILMMFVWTALPMAILMAVQFESSPRSWVNLGVAGHRGQIFAAPGRIRPAGTFSFVNGPIGFFSIALAALIAGAVDLRGVSWPLRIAGWVGRVARGGGLRQPQFSGGGRRRDAGRRRGMGARPFDKAGTRPRGVRVYRARRRQRPRLVRHRAGRRRSDSEPARSMGERRADQAADVRLQHHQVGDCRLPDARRRSRRRHECGRGDAGDEGLPLGRGRVAARHLRGGPDSRTAVSDLARLDHAGGRTSGAPRQRFRRAAAAVAVGGLRLQPAQRTVGPDVDSGIRRVHARPDTRRRPDGAPRARPRAGRRAATGLDATMAAGRAGRRRPGPAHERRPSAARGARLQLCGGRAAEHAALRRTCSATSSRRKA